MITLVFSALAVYRVTRMVVSEEGPFRIFSRFQGLTEKQDTWLKRGLNCQLCLGFWLALIPAILFPIAGFPWWLTWLAIAGLQTIIYQVTG